MTQLKIPLNIFLQHHNTDYSLAGLYCASIWTVSDGLHSSNMACSAVTEVKSTPLNWNRNIQLKTLRNNQSKNHQRNITLHIQIMFPFTDFWESFNFIALVLRDSGCLKCLNLKFCAENCRAPGQNWSPYPMPNVWMLCSFAQPLIHLDTQSRCVTVTILRFHKNEPDPMLPRRG